MAYYTALWDLDLGAKSYCVEGKLKKILVLYIESIPLALECFHYYQHWQCYYGGFKLLIIIMS